MGNKKKEQYKVYKSESNNEYLYLLRTGKYGKVGITGNLYKRLMQYRSHNPLCDLIAYGNMEMLNGENSLIIEQLQITGIMEKMDRTTNAYYEKQFHEIAKHHRYDLDWAEYEHICNPTIDVIRAAGGFIDEVGVPLKMFFKNPTLFLPETRIQIIE